MVCCAINVRFGSKADVPWQAHYVGFANESRQTRHHDQAEVMQCDSIFLKWDFTRKSRAKSKSNLRSGAQGRN
jgi:hypothetical protein